MPEVERGGRRLKKKRQLSVSLLIPSESRKEHLLSSFFSCQVTFEGCLVSSKQFLRSAELILLPCWQTSEVREGAILHCSQIWWDAPQLMAVTPFEPQDPLLQRIKLGWNPVLPWPEGRTAKEGLQETELKKRS